MESNEDFSRDHNIAYGHPKYRGCRKKGDLLWTKHKYDPSFRDSKMRPPISRNSHMSLLSIPLTVANMILDRIRL